jgi:hypothetical protein
LQWSIPGAPNPVSSQYGADANRLSIHPNDLTAVATGNSSFSADARFVGIPTHEIAHRVRPDASVVANLKEL